MAKASGVAPLVVACLGIVGLLLASCGASDGLDRLQETVDATIEASESTSNPDAAIAAGTEPGAETADESSDEADGQPSDEPLSESAGGSSNESVEQWADYASETGLLTAEIPDEPGYIEVEANGPTISGWSSEPEPDGYEITEFELAPGMPYDLDLGVIGTVAGAVDSIQEQIGQAATYEITEQIPDVRDGHEGVRFAAAVSVDDGPFGTIHGAVYNTGDTVVLLT
ncbi:MAG: hypothetical protein OEZ14_08715, partial [Acidimicrobiia bacterium]|nr:hypothetical protein [Acidimicrobiia bacterium]